MVGAESSVWAGPNAPPDGRTATRTNALSDPTKQQWVSQLTIRSPAPAPATDTPLRRNVGVPVASALLKPLSSESGEPNEPPGGRTEARRCKSSPPMVGVEPAHAASALPCASNATSTAVFTFSPAGRGTSSAGPNGPPGGRTANLAPAPLPHVTSAVPAPSIATRGEPSPVRGPSRVTGSPKEPPGGRTAALILWFDRSPSCHTTTRVPSAPNAARASRAGVTSTGIGPAASQAGAA